MVLDLRVRTTFREREFYVSGFAGCVNNGVIV